MRKRLSRNKVSVLWSIVFAIFWGYSQGIPQECLSYTVLGDADRHVDHGNTNSLCDSSIVTQWYRFTGAAGTAIPDTCPEINRCNTDAPGWLSEPHPTVAEGIVTKTVCYHWSGSCCLWSNTIDVLNCGDFYIYKLIPPPVGCNLRYCGTNAIVDPAIPAECSSSVYNELNEANRYWSNDDLGGSTLCDTDTIVSNQWYRFTGAAGTMMATYCIPKESCNTHRTAWINGDHPNVAYGLVSTTVCMHWGLRCCDKSYPVDIRNCSGYYVYKLQYPSSCSERYCGVNDENDACPGNDGSTECACPAGYAGSQCTDIDECAGNTHDCDLSATCTNTDGSFTCACNAGYTGDGNLCSDIDECSSNVHTCDILASCSNTEGSFTCSCNIGYTGDGQQCTDIDECAGNTHDCDLSATCTNTDGSFTCGCDAGYTNDGNLCSDIDECASNVHTCDILASCSNTEGSFSCSCNNGYTGDGQQCTDIDECTANSHDCVATCTNTDGSFTCACNAGYTGDGNLCSDIDECSSNIHTCDILASCSNTKGSFTCSCNIGYTGDGQQCTDIDECTANTHDCDLSATCTNTDGSFTCGCDAGYTGDGALCSDIDECSSNIHTCDILASCSNTEGSFTCSCNIGYTGDGQQCTDIDECTANTHDCDLSATCTNTDGSFTCACDAGYTGDGALCSDIDECASNVHTCDILASCSNTEGSFTCSCNIGYTGDGQQCTDIDECTANTHDCDLSATCTNTDGSFTCACDAGYTGNGALCSDIDECSSNIHTCDILASCSNTEGSFTCSCNIGYTGDGQQCTDIDECTANSDDCDLSATCANTDGSFTCACNAGYTGDGSLCSDIDECSANTHDCDLSATCTNTDGSFTCACNAGYTGDGNLCSDIDECAANTHNCHMNATCSNTDGSFNCTCNQGFSGNGQSCPDIDECATATHNCHGVANCYNNEGSFTCECRDGYSGDGIVNCEPVGDFSVSIRNISKDKYLATPVQRSLKTVLVAKIEGIEGINAFESVLEWRRVSEMELAASESSEGTLVSQGTNEWTINRRSIPAGIYQVKFTALYKVGDLASPQILNAFDYGFIEVVAAPLRAIIDEGSSARWGSVEIVTVDGSLSYDGDIGPGNYTGLNFTWSCLDAGDNSSTSYDCFGSFVDQGNVNFTAVKIDPSQLEFGKMYILRLTVSKDVRSSVAEMTFEIASGEIPRVSCRCFVDCGAIVSSSNKFRVTSECLNSVCDGATYQWQLEKLQPDSGVWEIVSNLDNITATPINASNIIIRPNTLLSNSQYRLQLTAKVPMQEAEGFAVLEFETAGKPFGGYCQSSATERDMQFTFECLEWQDKSTPITYEFRRGTKLISYGVSTKTDPILLSAGLPEENYRVQIDITIKNAVGEAVEETLILKVEPSSKLDPCHSAVEEVADNLNNLLLEMDEFLRNGEVIQGAQLALLVLASSRASHNTECGQSLPSHIQNNITCTVLIRFASITITAGSFQLTLLIGSVITAATEGNEQTCEGFNALEYTLNLTNNMVDLLGSALADLEEPFSAEIEEVARTSTECIKNVLKSTSGSGKEPKIGNSSESKANAEKALGQVEIIMDSISMRLVSSERQVIEMDELSISLSKVTSEKLDGMSVEEGPTQFRLPTNISQGAVGNIAAKMMTTAFNPFNWDSDNSSGIVRSSVCSLELSQDGTGTMNVSDLENDIEITIPINSDESESTEPENSFLKPYEMTVRSYYAELGKVPVSLSLSGLDKDAVVEVFIKFGSRPTVEDFDQNFTVALSVTCQNDSSDGEETKLPVMLNQLH
ncbi:hypothetical protein ACROYT_G041480 [Oculina patagonica]